jgi:predicted nuclease with TOPRIM domain
MLALIAMNAARVAAATNPVALAAITVASVGLYAYKGIKERRELNEGIAQLKADKESYAASWYDEFKETHRMQKEVDKLQAENKALKKEVSELDQLVSTL